MGLTSASFALLFGALRLDGRAFSQTRSRAFLLPRREKAVFGGGGVGDDTLPLAGVSSSFSHGKPGGDEGGLEARAGSSEKMALSCGGLEGEIDDPEDDSMLAGCRSKNATYIKCREEVNYCWRIMAMLISNSHDASGSRLAGSHVKRRPVPHLRYR